MKKEISFNNQKLYNCTTKETFTEYLEYNKKIFKMDIFCLITIESFIIIPGIIRAIKNNNFYLGIIIINSILVILVLIFNKYIFKFIMKISYIFDIKRQNSPLIYDLEFYENELLQKQKRTINKYKYNEFKKLIETTNNLYIQCKPFYRVIVIKKDDKNKNLVNFLKNKKQED